MTEFAKTDLNVARTEIHFSYITAHAVIYNLTHVVFEYLSKTREIPSSTRENLARYLRVLELCTSSAVLEVETRE